jgi:hypothetical protein
VANDRVLREANHGGSLSASDLRADRAGEKAVPTDRASRFQQHAADREHAGPAAPDEGD